MFAKIYRSGSYWCICIWRKYVEVRIETLSQPRRDPEQHAHTHTSGLSGMSFGPNLLPLLCEWCVIYIVIMLCRVVRLMLMGFRMYAHMRVGACIELWCWWYAQGWLAHSHTHPWSQTKRGDHYGWGDIHGAWTRAKRIIIELIQKFKMWGRRVDFHWTACIARCEQRWLSGLFCTIIFWLRYECIRMHFLC